MTASLRLFALLPVLAVACACSDTNPPAVTEGSAADPLPIEMTPPAVPTAVTGEETRQVDAQPAGPHGQHDPHGALSPDRLVKVALQHESEGRLELALKTLAEGIDKFPDAAELYAVRASLRLQMQQVSAALADLEKAAALDPDDPQVRVNRAQAYRAFGRYQEAMQDLDVAVERSPDLLPARFNRGALHYALNEFDEALVDFDHCVAVDPHAPAPYFNRASTYWELGRGDEAVKDLERFAEIVDNAEWKRTAEELLLNWRAALAKPVAAAKTES